MYTSETHKHTHFNGEGSEAGNSQGKMCRVDREGELGVSLDEQRQHHKKQNKGNVLEEMV